MHKELDSIRAQVSSNCAIADAQHASEYSLCTYLLKMRELFRWETRQKFGCSIEKDALGNWVREREKLWQDLENAEFQPIKIENEQYAVFDTEAINRILIPHGMIYSGGIGHFSVPHFFLGELLEQRHRDHYKLYIVGMEHARDLAAPPAMTLQNDIFIRKESLRRMLWEKAEEWMWKKYENPMGRALAYYHFDADTEAALDQFLEAELEPVIQHEIGEATASHILGDAWHQMLATLPYSRTTLGLNALRDHIADALATLPYFFSNPSEANLHFYFGNFRALRQELYPGLRKTYDQWCETGDLTPMQEMAESGKHHWIAVAKQSIQLFTERGTEATASIDQLLKESHL